MSRKCSCGWKCTQHTKIPPRFLKGWVNSLRFSESCRQSYCSKQGTAWFFFPPSLVQVNLNNHMLLKLKWKQKVNFFPKENQQALYVLLLWIFFPVKPFCILHTWLQRKTDWSALGCAGNLTEYACIWGKHSCSLWPRMTRSVTTRDWLVHYRIIWHLSHVGLNRNCFFVLLIKCKVFSHHVCKGVWRS